MLEAKLRMGLFDEPYVDEDRARRCSPTRAHREVARLAAERSAVLLRNEGDLLPLDAGTWIDRGHRSAGRLQARHAGALVLRLRPGRDGDRAGGHPAQGRRGDTVEYAPGVRPAQRAFPSMFDMFGGNAPEDPEGFDDDAELQRAVDLAREADVAVVVVGEWQNMIGEAASRSSLELPGRQLELLQAVVETGTPVVLLVMNGRPLDLRWAAERCRRSSTSGTPARRAARRSRTCCSATSRRAASCRSPGRGRSGRCRWSTPTPPPTSPRSRTALLGRGEHAAVPVRARPELRDLRVRHLTVDRDVIAAARR